MIGCVGSPPPTPDPPAPHGAGFDALWEASIQGDLPSAAAAARAIRPPDDASELASALGFVQVALDRDELIDGALAVALACGRCHRERAIRPVTASPAPVHGFAWDWLAFQLVWSPPPTALAVDPELVPLRDALRAADPRDEPLALAWRQCVHCHATTPKLSAPGASLGDDRVTSPP